MADTIIIGAGITGLTLAYLLKEQGQDVLIIDSGVVGGLIQSSSNKGFLLEHGPNVLVAKPEISDLLTKLGLSDSITYPAVEKYKQLVWTDGRALAVPRSFLAFIFSEMFSPGEKLKILFKVFKKDILRPAAEDETVADFFSRLIGYRAVDDVLDPALKGIFGGSCYKLSAKELFPGIWNAASEGQSFFNYMMSKGPKPKIFVLRQGASSLVRALQAKIGGENILSEHVEEVTKNGKDFLLKTNCSNQLQVKRLIVTTSGAATASFIKSIDEKLSSMLSELKWATLNVVHLSVSKTSTLPERAFGVLFPEGSFMDLLGIMFNSQLFPHLAPSDSHLLTACLGGVAANAEGQMSASDRAMQACKELLGYNEIEVLAEHKWPRAIPQLEVGHYQLEEKFKSIEANNAGLYFCGTDRGGIGVPDRIRVCYELLKGLK